MRPQKTIKPEQLWISISVIMNFIKFLAINDRNRLQNATCTQDVFKLLCFNSRVVEGKVPARFNEVFLGEFLLFQWKFKVNKTLHLPQLSLKNLRCSSVTDGYKKHIFACLKFSQFSYCHNFAIFSLPSRSESIFWFLS